MAHCWSACLGYVKLEVQSQDPLLPSTRLYCIPSTGFPGPLDVFSNYNLIKKIATI